MQSWKKLTENLNKQLGLTPYESRAYVSLVIYGPMSPSELAQKANIPRPRIYDVLKSLVEKGLIIEQSEKPSFYASTEPRDGLKSLLIAMEKETLVQLEEKREAVEASAKLLSQMYEKSKRFKLERSKVWFTQRDSVFIAIYSEAIINCENELLVASTSLRPPEKEVLEAVKCALDRGISVKVVRQITESWTPEELESYGKVVESGSQVRYLDVKEIPLRFMVFDQKDVILVFPSESEQRIPQPLEALWLRIPPLAKILSEYHEELWRRSRPIQPILEEIKKEKQKKRKRNQKSNS